VESFPSGTAESFGPLAPVPPVTPTPPAAPPPRPPGAPGAALPGPSEGSPPAFATLPRLAVAQESTEPSEHSPPLPSPFEAAGVGVEKDQFDRLFLGRSESEAESFPSGTVNSSGSTVPADPAVAQASPEPSAPLLASASLVKVIAVEVQESKADRLVALVKADGRIATYKAFTLTRPPRLVLDIPAAIHGVRQQVPGRRPLVTAMQSDPRSTENSR